MDSSEKCTPSVGVVLFESERLAARHYLHGGGKDRVVVSFVGRNSDPDLRHQFARDFCDKYMIPLIAISCASNAWYQYFDFPDLIREIEPILQEYSEVIFYGASMGGYGALLACQFYTPAKCIALSPQYSAKDEDIPFDGRWKNDVRDVEFIFPSVSINPGSEVFIIYDNFHSLDKKHVKLISSSFSSNSLYRIGVPFSGHVVGDFSASYLGFLVRAVFRSNFCLKDLLRRRREVRLKSPVYFVNAASELLARNKYSLLKKTLAKASEVGIRAWELQLIESKVHVRENELFDALCAAKAGVEMERKQSSCLRQVAFIYKKLGWLSEAELMIALSLEVEPNSYANHYLAYQIRVDLFDYDGARSSLRRCIELRPDILRNKLLLKNLGGFDCVH